MLTLLLAFFLVLQLLYVNTHNTFSFSYTFSFVHPFLIFYMLSILHFLWILVEIIILIATCFILHRFIEPLMLDIDGFPFPFLVNISVSLPSTLFLGHWYKLRTAPCTLDILITAVKLPPEKVVPIYNPTDGARGSNRLNDSSKIKGWWVEGLGSSSGPVSVWQRWDFCRAGSAVSRGNWVWMEATASEEEGRSNEATWKGEPWVDNTCDFILPLKLLFPLPPPRSIQTKEKQVTLTSFLPRVSQEHHTGLESVGRAEVRSTLPIVSWACWRGS